MRESQFPIHHEPVLVEEVLHFLVHGGCRLVVDCTLGLGGHAEKLLEALPPECVLIGMDRDPEAISRAGERLKRFGKRVVLRQTNFRELRKSISSGWQGAPDAVLFDLGVSSVQLEDPSRGFGFKNNGILDMRMDPRSERSAMDLIGELEEGELRGLFSRYGEERFAGRIAKAIIRSREREPIVTTGQLARLIASTVPGGLKKGRIHPATRVFQAIRIVVNDELGALEEGLRGGIELLRDGGRIAVISYHSLEDRIVKREFLRMSGRCICPSGLPSCTCGRKKQLEILTKKPVVPKEDELKRNPRARSAKLRVAQIVKSENGDEQTE